MTMGRGKRIALVVLLALLLTANAFAEQGLNAFMGSAPAEEETEDYHPKSNTGIDADVDAGDSLVYYFYRPTCRYCSERADMIIAGLPEEITLADGSKSKIRLVALNKSDPDEGAIIQAYYERKGIPEERQLVPTLIIGESYLCGSVEIKNSFLTLLLSGEGRQTPYIDEGRNRN